MIERYDTAKKRSIGWKIRRRIVTLLFNSKVFSRLRNTKSVICLGDSHIKVFTEIIRKRLISGFYFDVLYVPGATAQGIVNPRSQTNALQAFQDRLQRAQSWQTLIVQLGEVDCGFVIWYRAEKHISSVEQQFQISLDNYFQFLQNVKSQGFQTIIVLSVPLPTIKDQQNWGKVASERSAVKASQRDRTVLTLRYNAELAERCHANGYHFVDVTSEQLNPETGLIDSRFLAEDPLDHHLNNEVYGQYIARQLLPLLQRLRGSSTVRSRANVFRYL